MGSMNNLRLLPSVDELINSQQGVEFSKVIGREIALESIRSTLIGIRQNYQSGQIIPSHEEILNQAQIMAEDIIHPSLVPVINATGVVLHTNLGRAPLSPEALKAVQATSCGYCTLEYDLALGTRGTRTLHAEKLLQQITGAEAALVVNNNASAVLLILSGLANRKQMIISRSQLVEIGGGFRIPDIIRQAGVRLVEVGTTNRVHTEDYQNAINESTGLILRAHHSNFKIIGFTSEPHLAELAAIAHQASLPLVDDLGSGALLDTTIFGLAHEPMVQESVAAGADLVCFSGDKLIGGPQAGIIIGKEKYLNRIKNHPLTRAVRSDKMCLAGLSATLVHYLKCEAEQKVPIWRMISMSEQEIHKRAHNWQSLIGVGNVVNGKSTIGGGSLPEETLPTWLLALNVAKPNLFLSKLRSCNTPVIARLENNQVILDPRTVLAEQELDLITTIKRCLGKDLGEK
jgi:L-seryl-tRNA(Ser) seleniumtransferase